MKKIMLICVLVLLAVSLQASTWRIFPKAGGDLGMLTYDIVNKTATYVPAPGGILYGDLVVYSSPGAISCYLKENGQTVIRFTFFYKPALNLPAGAMVMDGWYTNYLVSVELAIEMVRQ